MYLGALSEEPDFAVIDVNPEPSTDGVYVRTELPLYEDICEWVVRNLAISLYRLCSITIGLLDSAQRTLRQSFRTG